MLKTLSTILQVAKDNPLYIYLFCFALIAFLLLIGALVSTL